MPSIKCEKCGRVYDIKEQHCPQCGNETPSNVVSFTPPDPTFESEIIKDKPIGFGLSFQIRKEERHPRKPIDQRPKEDNHKSE